MLSKYEETLYHVHFSILYSSLIDSKSMSSTIDHPFIFQEEADDAKVLKSAKNGSSHAVVDLEDESNGADEDGEEEEDLDDEDEEALGEEEEGEGEEDLDEAEGEGIITSFDINPFIFLSKFTTSDVDQFQMQE